MDVWLFTYCTGLSQNSTLMDGTGIILWDFGMQSPPLKLMVWTLLGLTFKTHIWNSERSCDSQWLSLGRWHLFFWQYRQKMSGGWFCDFHDSINSADCYSRTSQITPPSPQTEFTVIWQKTDVLCFKRLFKNVWLNVNSFALRDYFPLAVWKWTWRRRAHCSLGNTEGFGYALTNIKPSLLCRMIAAAWP